MRKIKKQIKKLFKDEHDFLENYIKTKIPKSRYKKSIKKKIINNKNIIQYKLTREEINDINRFWRDKLGFKVNLDWHRAYYATNGIEDCRYIPEDIFYKVVEPRLNRYSLEKAYSDKNYYSKTFSGFSMPKTLIRNINGNFYDEDYTQLSKKDAINIILEYSEQKFVIKPSLDTGGGRNVRIVNKSNFVDDNVEGIINKLFIEFEKDYLIQEYVNQHKLISEIYPNSLNTLRIISLRYEGQIYILSRIIRMGDSGSVVDNSTLGGLSCGYNSKGILNSFATEHYSFKKHDFHPYTKVYFKDRIIPSHDIIDSFVTQLHERLYYFDIASWDIAVKEDGAPTLIEVNLRHQDLNFHQRNNGPLFGDLTEDILKNITKI